VFCFCVINDLIVFIIVYLYCEGRFKYNLILFVVPCVSGFINFIINFFPLILEELVIYFSYCFNSIQFIYVQNLIAQRPITKLAQARKWEE
jgi:hypothetical protein